MTTQVIGKVKLERTRSNTMTLAYYYAKQAVKEEWQRRGLRPHHIVASQLNQAADDYLSQHQGELVERALAALRAFEEKRKH